MILKFYILVPSRLADGEEVWLW